MQIKKVGIACGILLLLAGIYAAGAILYRRQTPITVGILHSLTGRMAESERPVVDATLFAIEEINAKGGLLGRRIEAIIEDGASDPETFAKKAEMLITEKKVDVIFGCWSSAGRKLVKKVVEDHNHLLFYPVQYEGVETSENIFYTGSTPSQQMFPSLIWCMQNIGNRFFVVGSDYVYPRIAGMIARALFASFGAVLVGEEYIPLASDQVDAAIDRIKETGPDVIINMINGETNKHFFSALRAAGITSDKIPTMSFSIGEPEVKAMGSSLVAGDYAAWSYFETIDSSANSRFVQNYKQKYGEDSPISDPMEAAYFGVYLWRQAVQFVRTTEASKVIEYVQNKSYVAPEGIVSIDGYNRHTWKYARIGKIQDSGLFEIIWSSGKALYPIPYPFKSREEWDDILSTLYANWGGRWQK